MNQEKVVRSGKGTLKVVLEDVYGVKVTYAQLEQAIAQLELIAIRNTNSNSKDDTSFDISKFNIFKSWFSLDNGFRARTPHEVASISTKSPAEASTIVNQALFILSRIAAKIAESNTTTYSGMHGIRVKKS